MTRKNYISVNFIGTDVNIFFQANFSHFY